MATLAKGSPQGCESYNKRKDEDDWSETCKHVTTVRCVCFSNCSENLGLGEIATTSKQDVPCVAEVCDLQHVQRAQEDRCSHSECAEDKQPRLVSETGCDVHDDHSEQQDEEERLKTGSIQHEVHLWMRIERKCDQQICQKHGQEQCAKNCRVTTSEHVECNLCSVSEEQNCWSSDETFPTETRSTESNSCEDCVRHSILALLSNCAHRPHHIDWTNGCCSNKSF